MANKIATARACGTAQEAVEQIAATIKSQLGEREPTLLISFSSTTQPLADVSARLQPYFPSAAYIGASTAGEFTEAGDAAGSVCAFAVAGDIRAYAGMGGGLKADAEGAIKQALADQPEAVDGLAHRTCIMLVDPLAGNAEETAMLASVIMGGTVPVAGGAAGDDLKMEKTLVSCGASVQSDAVAMATVFSKAPLGIGVCHGHAPLSELLTVTRATDNVVHEVNGRPAWEVWAEKTRASAAKRNINPDALSDNEVVDYLIRYEAGLPTGKGHKIRVPLSRAANGALNFACGVPEGTAFRITESEPEAQVASAREAARRALAATGHAPVAGALVFDCVCRKLILRDDFAKAVHAIRDELGGLPLAGFETYGEIAFAPGALSGFHNTTTVVLTFPD